MEVVKMEANLIVTYEPTHAGKAKEEVTELLSETGGCEFLSQMEGLFLLRTKTDAKKIVAKLHDICQEESYKFKYTNRWIRVEKWTSSRMEEMEKTVKS